MSNSCLAKLKPGEPFFVLRGQDLIAPDIVDTWAQTAHIQGCSNEKFGEALVKANAMRKWPNRKYPD